jgi:hypothetical protein
MPIQLNEETGGKLLAVHVSGKLTVADYEHFVPEFERLAGLHGAEKKIVIEVLAQRDSSSDAK